MSIFRRRFWLIPLVLLLAGAAMVAADWWFAYPLDAPKGYVGGSRCITCHEPQHQSWQGSHHDLAMDVPTESTVRGDFQDAEFEYHSVKSRFFRKGDRYVVSTDGPDGEIREYAVKYTFGWTPLQQYLVELPGGRLQVLPFCWDVGRKEWFHIYRDDPQPITHDDPLHWTGRAQNWNYMCAECHSTDLRKNYDIDKNEYRTEFSDIDVNCEACHGPGSMHVDLAENKLLFWDRNHGYGLAQLKGKDATAEMEACSRCHSHKRIVHDGFHPGRRYMDHFSLAGIDDLGHLDPLYFPDGQIRGEVYELGSFQQSHMYRKGVRCTDCHDPHTLGLKREGNRLCTECHIEAKYDTPQHHRHVQGGEGSKCIECHMPTRTYMVNDPRRDHSLRMPRPDLSVKLGTPNSCTGCHLKKDSSDIAHDEYQDWLVARERGDSAAAAELKRLDEWAAEKVASWYDDKFRKQEHYGEVFAAARARLDAAATATPREAAERDEELAKRLIRVARNEEDVGPNVRASATAFLGGFDSPAARETNHQLLKDAEPQVRLRALANLEAFHSPRSIEAWTEQHLSDEARQALRDHYTQLRRQGAPLLSDPVRAVRIEAARVVSIVPRTMLKDDERVALGAAVEEFMTGQEAVADEPGAHLNSGVVWGNLREFERAEKAYLQGIRLDRERRVAPLRINLALLYNFQERKAEAERLLREAVDINARLYALEPAIGGDYAEACYYLGLRLLDQADADETAQPQRATQLREEAALYFSKASDLARAVPAYRETYIETLVRLERIDEARRLLRDIPQGDAVLEQMLYAIVAGHVQAGRFKQALLFAERRAEVLPEDAQAREDVRALREKVQ